MADKNVVIKRWDTSVWDNIYPKTTIANVTNLSSTLADLSSDITDVENQLNDKEPSFSKNTAFNKNFGSTAGTVAQGNDYRLSDARTPTAHPHSATDINVSGISVIGKSTTGSGATAQLGMSTLQTMLGLGSLAYSSATIPTNTSQLTNGAGFITSSSSITGTAANVTGTVAIANGGTGQTTKANAFNALSPMTSVGDIIYGRTGGTGTRLAGNTTTARKFLRSLGNGTQAGAPSWDTVTKKDVGLGNVTNESKATMFASPTFTGTTNIGSGSPTWTIDDTTENVLTFKKDSNYMAIKSDGVYFNGTKLGSGTVNDGKLTLAVSGVGLSGSQTFSANQSTNAKFTVTSNATSLNTASTIVARDANKDFSANIITTKSVKIGNGEVEMLYDTTSDTVRFVWN